MAAFVASGITFTTASGTKTVTLTPAVGELIVIITAHTGNTSAATPTDDNSSGTYSEITACAAVKNASADQMRVFIRTQPIPAAVSTIFSHAPGASSGGGLCVIRVSGMTKQSTAAARQGSKQDNQAAAGTPTPVLPAAALTANMMIGAVFNATNPAGLTPRSSPAYTERHDVGYNTPATGLEVMTLNNGETASSIAWGGTSASAFGSTILELDATPSQPGWTTSYPAGFPPYKPQHRYEAAPPLFQALPSPNLAARAEYPSWFPPKFPQHRYLAEPPIFPTLPPLNMVHLSDVMITVPFAVQYQSKAAPIETPAPVPNLVGLVYPDRFIPGLPFQESLWRPPPFETLPAPNFSWDALYPRGFPPRFPEHLFFTTPPLFELLPAPDGTAKAFYPDRLFRLYPEHQQEAFSPFFDAAPAAPTFFGVVLPGNRVVLYPLHPQPELPFFQTLPTPDSAWRALYPDRFRERYPEHYIPPVPFFEILPSPESAWKALYPDRFRERYPQHYLPPVPLFQIVPAPDSSWYTMYPAGFPPRYPEHYNPPRPLFETLPAPDYSWRAYFQDRLERILALKEYPQAVANIFPIAQPAPDFGQRALFPDRLDWRRALWPYPQSVMNLEPIPFPVPDFNGPVFPSRLLGFKPAPWPDTFYVPTPTNFLVLEDYSRGLHVGDIRGFYHTPDIATCEPFAFAEGQVPQTITSGAVTTVDLRVGTHGGIISFTPNFDRWGLIDVFSDRITIKHRGYYLFFAQAVWDDEPAAVAGTVDVRLNGLPSLFGGNIFARDVKTAFTGRYHQDAVGFRACEAGDVINLQVLQTSGFDRDLVDATIIVIRFAGPVAKLPS